MQTQSETFVSMVAQTKSVGWSMASSLLVSFLFACIVIVGWQPPLWMQPSMVGLIWGSLFLSGFGIAWLGKASAVQVGLHAASATFLVLAFRFITDLSLEECLIASITLVGSGWLACRLDLRLIADRFTWVAHEPRTQLSILDLLLATTLVACAARAYINLTHPPLMLYSMLGTLLLGCGCSWACYHWTWNDRRPVGVPLLMVAFFSLAGLVLIARVSPLGTLDLTIWLLVGPLSVLAAQCFVVMTSFSMIRWQNRQWLAKH